MLRRARKASITRKRGLDREANKTLLLKHVRDNAHTGSKLQELLQVLPALSRFQVQTLVREMKREGRIVNEGATNAARWFPADKAQSDATKRNSDAIDPGQSH